MLPASSPSAAVGIKITAAPHLACLLFCPLSFCRLICCPRVIIHSAVADGKNKTKHKEMTEERARETRAKVNSKTAGHAVLQRPWEVGLHKALQKPCETLSKYIKDTVCSSSPLLFLLPSSLGPFWRPLSPYVPPEDIFFLLYTSAVCFFIQSFVQTFFFWAAPSSSEST